MESNSKYVPWSAAANIVFNGNDGGSNINYIFWLAFCRFRGQINILRILLNCNYNIIITICSALRHFYVVGSKIFITQYSYIFFSITYKRIYIANETRGPTVSTTPVIVLNYLNIRRTLYSHQLKASIALNIITEQMIPSWIINHLY